MSVLKRREIIMLFAAFAGFVIIADYFFVLPSGFTDLSENIVLWGVITSSFAVVLGLVNVIRIHLRNISKREPGKWYFSLLLLVMLVTMIGVGIILGQSHTLYQWLFRNIKVPLDATMYSILGFYIASSAYRALRVRGVDSTIFIGAAIVIMLTNAPIGEAIWKGFPIMGKWIMEVPVMAGMRSIILGVAVGSLVYALRVLVGIETRYAGASVE